MRAAFNHYKSTCSDGAKKQLLHLYVIEHRCRSTVVLDGIPIAVQRVRGEQPWRQCQRNPCARCGRLQGGYEFKWYSGRWGKRYDEIRDPRALSAAEIEAGIIVPAGVPRS